MKGVFCVGGSIQVRADLPEPVPGPGEEVLRVRLAGICDTDLQLARGYMRFEGVLGHEFVALRGDGSRVTSEINFPCHACPTCRQGRGNHCPNRTVLGILNHAGAMAERVAVPTSAIHPIPDAIDDHAAVFIEPLAAAFRMVEQLEPGPGTRLAVLGDGKLGLLCAWVAATTGAEVHLIGKHPAKLALAGPGVTTHPLSECEPLTQRFDVVVDATGSPSGLASAMRLVRPRGAIVLKTTVSDAYEVDLSPIVIHEIRLFGSRCGPFPRAIEALASGSIDVKPLLQEVLPMDRAEEAFTAAARPGARKVILAVDG